MPQPLKKGVLGKDEKAYIDRNFRAKSSEEMAAVLNRSPSLVQAYVLEQGGLDPNAGLLTGLRTRPEWKRFQLEFSAEELETFDYHYVQLMGQFGKDEILPTEEIQIFAFIRCELLMGRNLREQKKIAVEMDAVVAEQDAKRQEAKAPGVKDDKKRKIANELKDLADRYRELTNSLKDVQGRYNATDARQSSILKELKGTRDQRVKLVENSKHSYPALLKMLMLEEIQQSEAAQMREVQIAVEKERARLAKPHKFADGIIDQPLLTSETITDDYSQDSPTPPPAPNPPSDRTTDADTDA